jgi:hypothetical protein
VSIPAAVGAIWRSLRAMSSHRSDRRAAAVALALVALLALVAACGGTPGSAPPTVPPSGSVDADRMHYAQNANRLAACDSVLAVGRARTYAEQELAAFDARQDISVYPAAVENSQAAARQAWGPLGYPDDRVGDAIDAADAALTAFAGALGRYEGGGSKASTVGPAAEAMEAAFDALAATLSEVGLACPA